MRMARTLFKSAIAVAALTLLLPGHAHAEAYDEDTCYLGAGSTTCTTPADGVEAHNSQHWVQVYGAAGHILVVRDKDPGHNNAIVYSGNGQGSWVTIYGLYGETYVLSAANYSGVPGYVRIRNYT
ncbi:hypothetical protein GCM10009555_002660 [Acrocarpospora macrocephala]|uniref:Uncharacterized protein n=2 Tax=Acrocarpospora macrocephala TaxID=150177 RepID=A0A5M3WWR5_9ACTN|nr:hypothetical protein Amac_053380 [Acrocarpospora macrocephala]